MMDWFFDEISVCVGLNDFKEDGGEEGEEKGRGRSRKLNER